MVKKAALFAFRGELMCFVHVLLNALDLKDKGYEVRIVIEGSAAALIPKMAREGSPLSSLYQTAKEQGLFEGACRACSATMGVTEAAEAEGLTLLEDMSGHPGMSRFLDEGYQVISF